MALAEFAVTRRVAVVMATCALILVGIISVFSLPQEYFPKIQFPQITIVTDYSNAAPEEIETLITRPIEETIGSVPGIKRIESVSREGRSTITASFNWGQNIDFAALGIREKIDLIKERLPKEADDPIVLKFDPLATPIMLISVTGPKLDPVRLKHLTEKMMKDRLEKVEGVASVSISGGVNREILVNIDHARLEANHLSLMEVTSSLDEANVSYPAGSIKKGLYEYLIRTVGEFKTVQDIATTVVGTDIVQSIKREEDSFVEKGEDGPRDTIERLREELDKGSLEKRLIFVRDIGEVIDGLSETTSYSRYNGKDNIQLSIQKQSNANTIKVVEKIKKELGGIDKDLKARGIEFKVIYDHSVFIRQTLEDLTHAAIEAAVLVLIILLIFLKDWASSLVAVINIPLSILGVFFMMTLTKYLPFMGEVTINIMSLGGLSLAIGLIVDTSVVVIENIFRKRQEGMDAEQAAVEGANEITWPVIGSNLTTIVVFFPLIVFVPGIPGQMFKDLSWAIVFSQIISMILPLTLITMLCVYLKVKTHEYKPISLTGNLDRHILSMRDPHRQNHFMIKMLLGATAFMVFSLLIVPTLDREVLPKVDRGQFQVKIDMPMGTRLDVTDQVSKQIEEVIAVEPDVENIAVAVGSEKSGRGEVKVESLRASQAQILVTLKKKHKRSTDQVVDSVRKKMEPLRLDKKSARVEFIRQESEFAVAQGGVKPIVIEIKGYNLQELERFADSLRKKLLDIPGVTHLQDDRGEKSPETKLDINKRRAALYGISAMDISLTAKTAIEGAVATQFREEGREIDVRVRLRDQDRDRMENIENLLLYSKVLDQQIPLKELASIERGMGPSEIRRIDQERTITILGEIESGFRDKDVLEDVQKMLAGLDSEKDIPADTAVALSGKLKEIRESFGGTMFAFILAIVLVYMVMASQFESILQPFLIMFTIPFSFCGALFALKISGGTLNVISLLGFVLLGGVVVNNGIVLIEYMNQRRQEGEELVSAVWSATRIRTRPVLMTAIANIVSMVPVIFGSDILRPMAVTVMGGMFSSTVLTLVLLPCLYILLVRYVEIPFFGVEADPIPGEDELPNDEART
ncbi:MAG TPA: efflux RND transporter permease subunit [Candidatus Omnitrophota bacterium]|nr:efflux RND transporter permease subunit [Candidatus Omnitrophota bacterium]